MRSASPQGDDRLLLCNLDRTVVCTRDQVSGQLEVRKLLLRGSLADAQREVATGQRLHHLQVVHHLGAESDGRTSRPCVRTQFHDGDDLDTLVARQGAVPAARACAMLLPVAQTLAAMHDLRATDLPLGLCHGDVKPANLLHTGPTTLLLDFEHAAAAGSGRCRGTPGFAAPEAVLAQALTPAFDVFGLGATLHWLLAGTAPRCSALRAQHEDVQRLVSACLSPVPAARPSAAVVAEALAALARQLTTDAEEPARQALLTGDLARCRELLSSGGDRAARQVLFTLLRQRERLLARRPQLLAELDAQLDESGPRALTAALRQCQGVLRRFPGQQAAVRLRTAAVAAAARVLGPSFARATELVRDEHANEAKALLTSIHELAATAIATPGGLQVPGDVWVPSLLQRAPLQCIAQEQQRLRDATAEHERLIAPVTQAEARLALDEAELAIDHIAGRYGGTSLVVARRRDRLHRLGFALERIGQAWSNVTRLGELLPHRDHEPLRRFVGECANAARQAPRDDFSGGTMNLRNLQQVLQGLVEEFPALAPRALPALDCLDVALGELTDEAWQLVADAQQKLQAEPVPVRPLQLLVGRLDSFRMVEAMVDRPHQSRSQLLDRIEALRLQLEQAQATRDRLARGAEQALAKGHWTTGLFDMERAVTSLGGETPNDSKEIARLRQRLADAKRKKQEIETAQRRTVDLGARYAMLQDDQASSFTERLQLLRERHECLVFLTEHAPKDRGRLYTRDLREVEMAIAQEQAGQADANIDATDDPAARLAIARQALTQLEACAAASEPGGELPGRLHRLREHWQRRLGALHKEAETHARDQQARRRQRTWLAVAGLLLLVAAVGSVVWPWLGAAGKVAHAGSSLPQVAAEVLAGDRVAALQLLADHAGGTPAADHAIELAAAGPGDSATDWHAHLAAALATDGLDAAKASQCWRVAIILAVRPADAAARTALQTAVDAAAPALRERGITLPADAAAWLQAQR